MLACLWAALAASGCATVANGARPRIQVESHPERARVLINGHLAGVTPLSTVLVRTRSHRVELLYADGQRFEILFERRISGWFFANLALGLASGGIGMIVDALTGAMWSLAPSERTPWGRLLLYEGNDRLFLRVYRCVHPETGNATGPGPDGRCAGVAPHPTGLPVGPATAPPDDTPPEPPPAPSTGGGGG